MRRMLMSLTLVAAPLLAACDAWETAPPPQPRPAPVAAAAPPTFEDNGCLGYLLLQRAAIAGARAEGDAAALDPPIAAWRARGAQTLSAEELAQYETTSVANQSDDTAEVIAERAAACVTDAPS
jgi:hypothetical protein